MFKTLQMNGDENVMLISSRPSFNGRESILLHFRELDGLPAKIELSSQIANRPVKSLTQVNITLRNWIKAFRLTRTKSNL